MRANQQRSGWGPGALLVCVGAGLLARELGWLPAHVRIWDFWPLLVMLAGVSMLLRASAVGARVVALSFVGTSGVLLAGNLGFLAGSVTRFWPVLLMLLGLAVLGRRRGDPSRQAGDSADPDRLIRQYTCSGAQLRIESQAWKGGELGVTAGGVELDFRQASLDPQGAVLALRVLMGGVDIRVPDTWQVQCDVTPLLGGADDMTRTTQGISSGPRLRIVGSVTLGGVSIQN